jgi:hypothetical protein
MDFMMVDGIHMMEKEKLIAARDRDVTVILWVVVSAVLAAIGSKHGL